MADEEADQDDRMPDAGIYDNEGEACEQDSSESDAEPVLAVTRARRANAGNRMSKLLELAEAEDAQEEYGEIFAEAADDVEFEAHDDDDADVNMESSSEDEDAEGPQDEDAGEKELKKEERQKSRKRKRETLLQDAMKRAAARVGPRVERPSHGGAVQSPTTESQPTQPGKPKKKSERVSWLPESSETAATRASSRQQTVQNKNAIHQRLKEKEKHRLKTVDMMKRAEERKQKTHVKVLTQEDRLEEAARTERLNSKSLNRWETNEKKRQEEQKARLAALKDHRLEGPIITYYSGPALWFGDKLKRVGKAALVEDIEEVEPTPPICAATPGQAGPSGSSMESQSMRTTTPISSTSPSMAAHTQPLPKAPPMKQEPGDSFLEGIEQYASTTPEPPPPQRYLPTTPAPPSAPAYPLFNTTPPSIVSYETPSAGPGPIPQHYIMSYPIDHHQPPPKPKPVEQIMQLPPVPKSPPRREIASRILIVLQDFENLEPGPKKEPDAIRHHLLGWPMTVPKKLSAPTKKPMCAVTNQPARYCDPATGLHYLDTAALRSMRRIMGGKVRWSELLGTFGPSEKGEVSGRPAKGVPECFLMGREEVEEWREKRRKEREVEREKALEKEKEKAREREVEMEKVKERAPGQAGVETKPSPVAPPPPPTAAAAAAAAAAATSQVRPTIAPAAEPS